MRYIRTLMENYIIAVPEKELPPIKVEGKPILSPTSYILIIALVGLVIFYVVMKKRGKI